MSKELESLKKHYIQLANKSNFKYTQFEESRFNIIEQKLERKEKLEKVWSIIVKEIEDSFISGLFPNGEGITFDFKILKKDKPEEFNLLKEMIENGR